ncbi:DUF417 family protein [Mucilaginibacter gossypii]|uniref:DUF417 family protein n=1 Tax=Mucilaginibacter gossypii TaxID=551996 RepID=UPI000DCDBFCD|nr:MULTISPECIES: DUF417 family protein [Mucilaginibacter]QTE38558.1 DUF417 family protein [Mucilaginibacter gossypii]RAV52836.1 hypothetical protein DIU36_24090 [Mucilaginibacter rubeus]
MQSSLLSFIAGMEQAGRNVIRAGVVIAFLWIGGLKFFTYEAEGIVPFVANSPIMSFFYNDPAAYKKHVNKEGELLQKNHIWHTGNGTYPFSRVLGVYLIVVAELVALYRVWPISSMIASILVLLMTTVTLSFLITTPEAWVPNLGDADWGFPFLSGRGRLVLKDTVIMGGPIITMSESAAIYLDRHQKK